MIFRISIILIFAINSISCRGKKIDETVIVKADEKPITDTTNLIRRGFEVTEIGLVKGVEDSGYPFATLTIEFPERKFTESFTINMEAVKNASYNILKSYIGKYVNFKYSSDMTYVLLDLFRDSRSIFGAEIAPEGDGVKAIEGVLYGAEKETSGDIPGEVSIFAKDGENLYFNFFITPEMVAVNEKKVTAFYVERVINTIVSIEKSAD